MKHQFSKTELRALKAMGIIPHRTYATSTISQTLLTMIAYYKVIGTPVLLKHAFDWRGEEL